MTLSETENLEEDEEPKEAEAEAGSQTDVAATEVQDAFIPHPSLFWL